MNIVFFGNPDFCSYPLLELYNSKHNIVAVVTNPDKKSGRGLQLKSSFVKKKALELNIPIIESDNADSKKLFNQLSSLNPDLFVVVAFSILPDSILSIRVRGSINIHPSLLPNYRGASPIQYSIINGDYLTEHQKKILFMRLMGKTQNEIAEHLGITQSAVHKAMHGNIDYKNNKKRYGGLVKKLK